MNQEEDTEQKWLAGWVNTSYYLLLSMVSEAIHSVIPWRCTCQALYSYNWIFL